MACPDAGQLKQMFEKFDADKDGHLVLSEFQALIASFCNTSTPEEAKCCFEKGDADKDGKLTCQEFCTLMEQKMAQKAAGGCTTAGCGTNCK